MDILRAVPALSEALSVESDVSTTASGRSRAANRRKQSRPYRATETPMDCQPTHAGKYLPSYLSQGGCSGASISSGGDSGRASAAAAGGSFGSGGGSLLDGEVEEEAGLQAGGSQQACSSRQAAPQATRKGPCCHCKTMASPQWRKGPRNKPVLCNACGIRFLRNRQLGRLAPPKRRHTKAVPAGSAATATAAISADATTDPYTRDEATDVSSPSSRKRTKQQHHHYGVVAAQALDGSMALFAEPHGLSALHPTTQLLQQAGSDQAAFGGRTAAGNTGSRAAGRRSSSDSAGELQHPSVQPMGVAALGGASMQQLLASAGSGGGHQGSYLSSMALAYQMYSQQQQQQQLFAQQQPLLAAAPALTGGLAAAALLPRLGSAPSVGSAPQLQLHNNTGAASSTAVSGTGLSSVTASYAALLSSPALQWHNLAALHLAQQQYQLAQQQQSHSQLLHGPSPLSVMTSAGLPAAPHGSTAAATAAAELVAARAAAPLAGAAAAVDGKPDVLASGNDAKDAA